MNTPDHINNLRGSTSDVRGIPVNLHSQLRKALLGCGPFDTDRDLKAVFVVQKLRPWRDRLPQADNSIGRVEKVIDFLYHQYNDAGENVLVLLVRVLNERHGADDDCYRHLADLADELEREIKSPTIRTAIESIRDPREFIQDNYFEPTIERSEGKLRVARDTVSIICKLPEVFTGGPCDIVLKRTFPPGMLFRLEHREILTSLLVGLKTDYRLNLRGFLKIESDNTITIKLGNTTFNITEQEADDLCYCVDEIFAEYKQIIKATEDVLQTWDYPRVEVESSFVGFHLLTVPKFLWEVMQKFANKFDYGEGKTEWHIFQYVRNGIIVRRHLEINTELYRHQLYPDYSVTSSVFTSDYIDIVYKPFISREEHWHDQIGLEGIWDANYTKQWILNDFIPAAIEHFSNEVYLHRLRNNFNLSWSTILFGILSTNYRKQKLLNIISSEFAEYLTSIGNIPLSKIQKPAQFDYYIEDIRTFHASGRIAADLILPYYIGFLNLSKYAKPSSSSYRYIDSNLYSCRCYPRKDSDNDYHVLVDSFEKIRDFLAIQIEIVKKSGYETRHELDMMCRVFLAILRSHDFHFKQEDLNILRGAIKQIWLEARFEQRYQRNRV